MSKPDLLKFSGSQAENAALAAISHPKYKKLKCTSLIGQSECCIMKNLLVKEIIKIMPNSVPEIQKDLQRGLGKTIILK